MADLKRITDLAALNQAIKLVKKGGRVKMLLVEKSKSKKGRK